MCIYITVICASKNKHGGNNWGTHEPIFSLGHFTAEAAPARHLDTSKEEKKKKKKTRSIASLAKEYALRYFTPGAAQSTL